MNLANFKFDLQGCTSFVFQHIYTKPYMTFNKTLAITFPSGEILKFKEAESQFPTQLPNIGSNGDLDSDVLADLDELGYNTQDGIAIIMVDIEQLLADVALNPEMFTLDGEARPFHYTAFPDGVYKAEFSYLESPVTTTAAIQDPQNATAYSGTKYSMKMCGALECRAKKIEEYFEKNCKIPIECRRRAELAELITRMRILELGALWDFSQKAYSEASKKIDAMHTLCSTGKCNYKVGC